MDDPAPPPEAASATLRLVDEGHDELTSIGAWAAHMHILATSFLQTGNGAMASHLHEVGNSIEGSVAKLRRLIGAEVSECVRRSEASAVATVGAVLAAALRHAPPKGGGDV